jgi:hypothetical protein
MTRIATHHGLASELSALLCPGAGHPDCARDVGSFGTRSARSCGKCRRDRDVVGAEDRRFSEETRRRIVQTLRARRDEISEQTKARQRIREGMPAAERHEELQDVPPALQKACLELVASYYRSSDRDPLLRSETVEGIGSRDFYQGAEIDVMSPEVRGLLNHFRRFTVSA